MLSTLLLYLVKNYFLLTLFPEVEWDHSCCFELDSHVARAQGQLDVAAALAEEGGRRRTASPGRQQAPSTANGEVTDPAIPQIHANKPTSEKCV